MNIMEVLMENVLIPILLILIGYLGIFLRQMIKKVGDKFLAKTDSELASNLVTNAMVQIDKVVEDAVASNMRLSEEYKKANEDGKLTDEEKKELKDSAVNKAKDLLPQTVTSDDVINLLGGEEVLDRIIRATIEKSLINFK